MNTYKLSLHGACVSSYYLASPATTSSKQSTRSLFQGGATDAVGTLFQTALCGSNNNFSFSNNVCFHFEHKTPYGGEIVSLNVKVATMSSFILFRKWRGCGASMSGWRVSCQ